MMRAILRPLMCGVLLPWLLAAADPVIFFSKSFPGSTPEYVAITVDKSGQGVYKEAPDDEMPAKFQVAAADVAEIFELAAKVDYFNRPLESGLKVAFMGEKTFRWDDGSGKTPLPEQKFNYTQDLDGQKLLDWFEKISQTEYLFFNLQRSMKFDRLGVHKALLLIEAAWDKKRIVGPDQFLPLVDRIAKNSAFMNIARERAAALGDAIRAMKNELPKVEGAKP